MKQLPVVVIGGGMAGLVAGYQLTLRGLRPLLLEQSAMLGGAVARHTVAGVELDAGAESFAVTRPAVTQLLGDLSMAGAVVAPAPLGAWVRHEAGSAPLPATALLGIPGHVRAADVRRVIGWPGAARATLDTVLPPRFGGPTLGGLVRRRMGSRVLHRLVEPVVGGVHAFDPSLLEVDAVAPGLTAAIGSAGSLAGAVRTLRGGTAPGAAVCGIRGGMALLPAALATEITYAGGEVRCGVTVSGLESITDGWRVHVQGATIDTAAVVVALPATGISQLLGVVLGDATMPADSGRSTPVALVTMVIDDARLDAAPRGTGILVAPRATGVLAKALTHATAKWPWLAATLPAGRHVLRLSYGRSGFGDGAGRTTAIPAAGNPAAANQTAAIPADGDLRAIAVEDASTLLGLTLRESDILGSDVVRWRSALPQAREGHGAAVATLRRAASAQSGLAIVGSALAGNGLAAVVGDARAQIDALADRIAAG
ncbi:MAG: FAD-dependent oxidoreductase [Actinomycetota bacterium]|nr:FAD-dependent oxidoreductase [Actinomycetota bacterium]